MTSPHHAPTHTFFFLSFFLTHDLLHVRLREARSLPFAVQRGRLAVWRAGRQLDVVGWMFGNREVLGFV